MEADQQKSLSKEALRVKEGAYCKYSKFHVGAALLCRDGTVFTGCNVENAVYPLTVCAERVAVVKAVSEGYTDFTAIAVATDTHSFVSPCGSCRQVLSEFSSDGSLLVVMARPDSDECQVMTISDLLPSAFSGRDLPDPRK